LIPSKEAVEERHAKQQRHENLHVEAFASTKAQKFKLRTK